MKLGTPELTKLTKLKGVGAGFGGARYSSELTKLTKLLGGVGEDFVDLAPTQN